ncbi:MAG: glycosyltransferase, partial [Candidatus Omnitrophica bacterium]|nr:glycosyltransferase [Candidatus Omnitrophota bacterium]
MIVQELKEKSMLIIGQHLTSRTEAVRDYFLSKVQSVYVVGLGSFAVNKKENHAFYYDNGVIKKHYIFKHPILKLLRSRRLLITITFLLYCVDILRSLLIFGKKFDVYIGISHFSGIVGVILKKVGVCRKFIYYTIDYYVPHQKECSINFFEGFNWFETYLLKLSIYIDKLAVRYCDEVWDISLRIEEGRIAYSNINVKSYRNKKKIISLGYDADFYRSKGITDIDRYAIVFVGVTMDSQGLELILDIIPELVNIMPEIIVKVIGRGPFLPKFKEMVASRELGQYFKFYGFIEDVNEMLDVVSSSAVGVSVWDDKNNRILNAYYGDPGKTKLYSVCGLPVVVSDITVYAKVITEYGAGVAIKYDSHQFLEALK